MLAIRTILYPTDFSESSEQAFRLACALARDYGARLVALHVVPPPTVVYAEGVVPPEPEEYLQAMGEKLRQLKPRDPKLPLEHRLLQGDPAAEILRVAEETGCDVIVLGTHGRTGLARLLMGSVAEQVVRRAPCPVVAVKTRQAETKAAEAGTRDEVGEPVGAGRG